MAKDNNQQRIWSENQGQLEDMLARAHVIDLNPRKSLVTKVDECFQADQSAPDRAILCVAVAWGYWSRAYGNNLHSKQQFINAIATFLETSL